MVIFFKQISSSKTKTILTLYALYVVTPYQLLKFCKANGLRRWPKVGLPVTNPFRFSNLLVTTRFGEDGDATVLASITTLTTLEELKVLIRDKYNIEATQVWRLFVIYDAIGGWILLENEGQWRLCVQGWERKCDHSLCIHTKAVMVV